MQASVECGVCGRRLFFDTATPINPEIMGWTETEISDMSLDAYMAGQTYMVPVCPECQDKHARMVEIFNPIACKHRGTGEEYR